MGLGERDRARNAWFAARLPVLSELLEGTEPLPSAVPWRGRRASLLGLDPGLHTAGLPQSGTGQTALLTGEDAVRLHGRHFGPWVPTALRGLLRDRSVLALAAAAGRRVAFANAYPEELVRQANGPGRLPSFLRAGPPLAAAGAGVLERSTVELERGDAVASEITNEGWRERLARTSVPDITAAAAGANLARIAAAYDLTLFAHYSTDYAGHERDLDAAVAALERVDAFLGGVLDGLADLLLVVASDHGNLEDAGTGHTRNPALCIAAGDGHAQVSSGWEAITDVAPAVLRSMDVP